MPSRSLMEGKVFLRKREGALAAAQVGVGVRGMEERVRQFGGTLQIHSDWREQGFAGPFRRRQSRAGRNQKSECNIEGAINGVFSCLDYRELSIINARPYARNATTFDPAGSGVRRGVPWGMPRMNSDHPYLSPFSPYDALLRQESDEEDDEEEDDHKEDDDDDDTPSDDGYSE